MTIYIYNGPGTSKENLIQLESALKACLGPSKTIKFLSTQQLLLTDWTKHATLFVIPGGADIPYMRKLNGLGNQKIRAYVESGGSFLGICAGSYYAGNYVEFALRSPLEVKGTRELSFFPGIVRGPLLAPYNYKNKSGARAAKIRWSENSGFQQGSSFTVFFNGGGYFVDATLKESTTVLANYEGDEKLAALIECNVGQGLAILSGVHIEYDSALMNPQDKSYKEIIPILKEGNTQRRDLFKHLIERLQNE